MNMGDSDFIDLVLVEPETLIKQDSHIRNLFIAACKAQGLITTLVPTKVEGQTSFVLIRASETALYRQAELEQVQVPIQKADIKLEPYSSIYRLWFKMEWLYGWLASWLHLQSQFTEGISDEIFFTDAFQRSSIDRYIPHQNGNMFPESTRIRLTWNILSSICIPNPSIIIHNPTNGVKGNKSGLNLDRRRSGIAMTNRVKTLTMSSLLKSKIYLAVFPLHNKEILPTYDKKPGNARNYLYHSWATFTQWHRNQPLDSIKEYFGEKFGFYFGWLGFYTQMLIFPSIAGLLTFIYGIFVATNPNDDIMKDFCYNDEEFSNRVICRDCPTMACPYTTLKQHCTSATLSRIVDNELTAFFSLFMALWAVVFVESWKRKQTELACRWDVTDQEFKDDQIRAEYQATADSFKMNPITQEIEPHVSWKVQWSRLWGSIASVAFFILIIMALIVTIVIYKSVGPTLWHFTLRTETNGHYGHSFSPTLMTSITASIINGIFIAIMSKIYMGVAWRLTRMESPRTEKDFEYSYTYKVFVFQFVNYFGTLFYLGFVRGQQVPAPHLQGTMLERCPVYGCFLDVSIQLFIIFIGKQTANNILELGIPFVQNKYRRWKRRETTPKDTAEGRPRWVKDYDLNPPDDMLLLDDYLEMLLQYTFVVMFSPAFPLAPLFALINNVIEIRLDATKHLLQTQRCLPLKAKDIGPWLGLVSFITKAAVVVNAMLIAFCADSVEQQVYFYHYYNANITTKNHTDILAHPVSFMDFTLTDFNPKLWCNNSYKDELGAQVFALFGKNRAIDYCTQISSIYANYTQIPVEKCYYRDYRDSTHEHQHSQIWWHVTLAKLIFIIVFENFALGLQTLIQHLISDTPEHVRLFMDREQYIQRQKFMQEEGIEPIRIDYTD